MICPVCHSNKISTITKRSREDLDITLISCRNCGHMAQPSENYEELYTTGEFTVQARDKSVTPSTEKIKELDKRALKRFDYFEKYFTRFQNTLEIGSSIGSFIHLLKLRGTEADGLEPDPAYAEFSQSQYGFTQHSSLLEDFEIDKKYDSLCSFHVLEHVKDPEPFLQKCKELMSPKATLLFEFPSLELHMYGSMKNTIWKPHIHYFTAASVYALFSKFFKVKKIGYYGSALFVVAENTEKPKTSKLTFLYQKLRAKVNFLIARYFPNLPGKSGPISRKQLLLQSTIFQLNKWKMVRKVWKLGWFMLKSISYEKKEKQKGKKLKATHISYYSAWENAGDTVLSKCVRDNFNSIGNIEWHLEKVTNAVTEKTIEKINSGDFLVIGGGGLLLPDSNPNTKSGWQWAITDELLDKIEVPIFVYAIGYNFFHGQEPNELFINSVKKMINKASFFSLRNYGSINKLNELLGDEFKNKIKYQPCPTTVIRKFTPLKPKVGSKKVGVNLAFDRYKNRFGGDIYEILRQVALALKQLEKDGYEIYSVAHLTDDLKFEHTLQAVGVNFKTINLQYSTPMETYNFYNQLEVMLGARGHAQMIPFGVNCKIISLGSHNKLKWFLDDIDATEWFVDLKTDIDSIESRILQSFKSITENPEKTDQIIEEKQLQLLDVTTKNLSHIKNQISQL